MFEKFYVREVQGKQQQMLKAERKKQQDEDLKALKARLSALPSEQKNDEELEEQ